MAMNTVSDSQQSNGAARPPQAKGPVALAAVLAIVLLITPMTASCQRSQSDPDRGIEELRALVQQSSGKPAAADLLRFQSRHPRTRAAALAGFLRGYLHYSAQNYESAAEAFTDRTIGENSSLGDYALFYRAECLALGGKKGDAVRDYGLLYRGYPDSLKARDARLRAAEVRIEMGDPASAINELAELARSNDADAALLTGRAHEARGQNEQALVLYRRIYYEMAATNASAQAEARLAALGASPAGEGGGFEEEKARADLLFEAKQYAEAAKAYESLIARFPEVAQFDQFQLRWGVSLANNKQPAQAVPPLTRVSVREPGLCAEALFYLAESLRRSNRDAESAAVVDRLLSQYRDSRRATEALYSLAAYLNKEGREAEAASRFRQLLSVYPTSDYAPEASYVLGWRAYRSGNYTDAIRILEQHLTTFRSPQTKFLGEAGFWAAKSHERLGNRSRSLALYDLVSARYRYGYHGYFAASRAAALRRADPRLKAEQPAPGSNLDRLRQNVSYVEPVVETVDESERSRMSKAGDLEVIGLTDLAIKELNQALESAGSSPHLNLRLAQVYARRGENFQATLTLRRGYPDIYSYRDADLPREAWEVFFPLTHWETIKEEAKRYRIDPYIVAGLIRQESVFNVTAISRVGARGLMQLMPSTGQLVAKRQGDGRLTTADLYNPVINIKLGMDYLAQMLGEFGRIEYAAAAYNAGPGRARRWVAERGSMDIEDWIETVPLTETRGYVQGVIRYSANYRRFYKE